MKKQTVQFTIEAYDSVEELPQEVQKLMSKAAIARDKAYAPYSSFFVGAALQLASGIVVTGNNQENAAFPSGLCAERVAVFYAGASYPGETITQMALTVRSLKSKIDVPTPPCGACRQALAEYEARQKSPMAIYFMGQTGTVIKVASVTSLLPFVFESKFLQ